MGVTSSSPVQQRLPALDDRPILFAHRGARAHAPENTIDAFKLGLRLGATGLESDVWLTADGVPVLDHDGVVNGWRKRPIAELLRANLPSHIPDLEQLLAECGTDYDLSLDLKDRRCATTVIDLVASSAPELLSRLWLCHPDYQFLIDLRPYNADVRLIDSTRRKRVPEGLERRAAQLANAGIDGINMHHSEWTGGFVTLVHRFRRRAFGWDMQFEHVLRPLMRMGIDAVYSDHVDVMVDVARDEFGDEL
ncbi:hypothetical protein BH18ACT3_BH18ACT3_14610 [soil metagenome]